jgi:hypothetical protein
MYLAVGSKFDLKAPLPPREDFGAGHCTELRTQPQLHGGIFMGSTVSATTRVWDCQVAHDSVFIDRLGAVERLRPFLGEGTLLEAGDLVWITDLTPHEAVPLTQHACDRQFFRLVTERVSVWYAEHSTANPLGTVPPKSVRIVKTSKFAPGETLLEGAAK